MNLSQNYTDLPASVIPKDQAEALPIHDAPAIGESVVIFSRGRYRVANVTKLGPKRVTTEYTTQGAIDTAVEIAGQSREARIDRDIAAGVKNAADYRKLADYTEAEGIASTDGVAFDATNAYGESGPFVSVDKLPATYLALTGERRGHPANAPRRTIVNSPAQLREWADNAEARIAESEAKRAEAREWDALPMAEKVKRCTHMTTKAVARTEVRRLP